MINNYSWVEKYRPSKLDEISSQNHIIDILKSTLITKNLPHLILFGPSGCGKTSTVSALAKELFGEENYLDRIIELNASDERGINIIREKIKNYAKLSIKNINNTPPWKIIILDEADTMTSDSQFALRRIIEQYSKITRFCIICNYHTKIIEPIISRCSLLRFKPIEEVFILERLIYICKNENMNYNDTLLNKIIKICRGDLRKAINLLQKCNNSYNNNDNNINEEILNEISGIIPDNIFEKLMKYIFDKDYKNIDLLINQIYNDGYSLVNQILLFHNYILNSNISNINKIDILQKIIEVDHNLINCSDEYIQLYNLIYYIILKS
jgi:replication factor C subunit 2/4